jgi:Spore coat polysaccharide biosynthesis protein F, CMP-KDO synthetase homolog
MVNGLITVRSQSTRLPEKCFLPFGNGNVIEHVIRRAKYFKINPIVCTTNEIEDDRIVEIAKNEDVRYFRGSVKDKLLRWRDCCRKYNLDKFVSIDADDPFFDGNLSNSSYKELSNSFDIIKHPRQQPNNGYYEGCVGYSLRTKIIEKACEIKNTDDTEMMWHFIEDVVGVRIGFLKVVDDNISFPIRLTLDYQEDYWIMQFILRLLGPFANRKEIIDLFIKNPDLYKINWFRTEEYKSAHYQSL